MDLIEVMRIMFVCWEFIDEVVFDMVLYWIFDIVWFVFLGGNCQGVYVVVVRDFFMW